MRPQYKKMKRFALGLAALVIGLSIVQASRADVIRPSPSTTRLVGAWGSVWSIDNTNMLVGLCFLPDGKCLLILLNEDGKIIQRQTGTYTYDPVPRRIGLHTPPEGVLKLRIGGKRIEERVRWNGPDQFVFVGSEEHPWFRIQLEEQESASSP